MAYYPDLAPCDYFGSGHAAGLRAVGWLERDHPVPTGDVTRDFFDKLCTLLHEPWMPVVLMGAHRCSLCRFNGPDGASNLFVPGAGFLFVAPALIDHYIDAHGYAPPREFVEAVMACPPMRSMQYLRAVLANGPAGLVRHERRARNGGAGSAAPK